MAKNLNRRAKKLQLRREGWATLAPQSHFATLNDKQGATKRPGSMNRKKG